MGLRSTESYLIASTLTLSANASSTSFPMLTALIIAPSIPPCVTIGPVSASAVTPTGVYTLTLTFLFIWNISL